MPSVSAALLAMALRDPRPLTDAGLWLDDPRTTRAVAPFDVTGEAQAPEGVLRVELYVVRGTAVTRVASYVPRVPVGTVPFTLRWDPRGTPAGGVTLRVVATTLVRGFSDEVDVVVPAAAKPRPTARPAVEAVPARHAAPPRAPAAPSATSRAVAPRVTLDDSGRAFGATAPVLPYARRATPRTTLAALPAAPATERVALPPERSGWVSVAAGLLVMLVCSHLHRLLRPQERGGR